MTTIFKYFSEGVLEHVFFRDEHVGIKCSLPEDYNDPFELFLGVDLEQEAELLATYSDVVQKIPSLLTTCFSKSPIVSPMWRITVTITGASWLGSMCHRSKASVRMC